MISSDRPRPFRLFLPLLVTLAGCTQTLHHNEGAVQIGRVKSENPGTSLFISRTPGDVGVITPGEAVSIKLVSAFICDFRESVTSREVFSRTNRGAKPCPGGDGNVNFLGRPENTSGEIAILANAGERTSTTGLTFNPATMQRDGRVVYYNEDVRESGQLINALNIPIYGPKTYEGGTFFLDLAVMELDNDESEQSQQLIRELAQIGSAAFAPATPVLSLLNSLGSALLGANGDDVELRYQLEFDPAYTGVTRERGAVVAAGDLLRAPLREGYYAVTRMEQRDQLPKFADMMIMGPPYNPLLANSNGSLYTGGSWLLIRVSREDHAQAKPQDLTTRLAELLDTANKTDQARTAELEAIVNALENLRVTQPPKSEQ